MRGGSIGGGALLGLVFVVVVIIYVAMTGNYKGREEPAPCTSADWKAYAPACNRWSPEPSPSPTRRTK